jgi:hypothetical protein
MSQILRIYSTLLFLIICIASALSFPPYQKFSSSSATGLERETLRPFSGAAVGSVGSEHFLASPVGQVPLDWHLVCSQLMAFCCEYVAVVCIGPKRISLKTVICCETLILLRALRPMP